MRNLVDFLTNNLALLYLGIYLIVLISTIIVFAIYRKVKNKDVETNSTEIAKTQYEVMSNDIVIAESFGNEPLSGCSCDTVIRNGSTLRISNNVSLVSALKAEKGNSI